MQPPTKKRITPTYREVHKEDPSPSIHADVRYWENYLVRYLLPTVVGAALVWILLWQIPEAYDLPAILKKRHPIDSTFLILIGFAGFVYCYVSSSLVLGMHYGRWTGRSLDGGERRFRMGDRLSWTKTHKYLRNSPTGTVLWTLVVATVLFFVSVKWLAVTNLIAFIQPDDAVLLAIAVMAIAWQWTKAGQALSRRHDMYTFYKALVRARSQSAHSDYIESYRHLREHGNAFFIVFAELFFFAYLCIAIKLLFPSHGHADPTAQIWTSIVLISAWIFPGVVAWFLGTELELRLVATETRGESEHAA